MPKDVNDIIADNSIIAQIRLLRLEESEVTKAIRVINRLQKDISAEIINIDPTAVTRTATQKARLERLNKSVGDLSNEAYRNIRVENSGDLKKYARYESDTLTKTLNAALGAEILKSTVTDKRFEAIIKNSMIDGKTIGKWWNKQNATFKDKFGSHMNDVMAEFQLGSIQGEPISQLLKRVAPHSVLMNQTKKQAATLVRTSFAEVANATRTETYNEHPEIFSHYQQISTLDLRTTPICRAYDRLLWDKNYKPVGHKFPWKSGPPRHWLCRSTFIIITKSYDELLDADNKFKDIPEGKRAAMKGSVPAKTTYDSWLKSQSESTQKEALGPGRYKLWKENKLSMADMIHQNGRSLTIKQLKAKYE